ncbi:MerR family transcriptional regulator [Streptomyces cocklensis]|uniref:MerR HTH family regulatory protein n=1 Tax=Actinacidiphila cocklensis TaxID=887465 RepID=A0A9W4GR84_9ACTN|nr:MerR family transcriptional regulator [Actinacidiphila cocklensis]MDD1057043.1 MerR family transcriptional regulator [Actinacidiphila cocklensis]CAG6393438.1 MerR HTH family regulatory protein [Actinacidiphila cocklensis]
MSTASDAGQGEYRIEDLSRLSGTTVRTIRAYTDRGLLPKPERLGRANVYDDAHLERLRQIADLLERGYTLASIKELLAAWDAGTGLGGVLGLVGEVDRPWSDEQPVRIGLPELMAAFGGVADLSAVEDALQLGVLVAVPGKDDEFEVPSPQELAVAVELHAAGVPLGAITGHLRELRGQVEYISERFLEFTTEYVFQRFLEHPPSDEEAAEAAALVRRLRPLAQQTVDAELARAMRLRATEHVRRHLGDALPPTARPAPPAEPVEPPGPPGEPGPQEVPVTLPAATVAAVRALVGPAAVPAFVAAAADREVAARRMDALTSGATPDPGTA